MRTPPPPLPPPPDGWRDEWQPAAPRDERSTLDRRPPWRQGRPGWALLNLAIGVGIWIAGLFVMGIVVAAAGRDPDSIDRAPDSIGGWFVLSLAGATVGWLLFAYLEGTSGRRWAALLCLAGGTWLIALASLLAATR